MTVTAKESLVGTTTDLMVTYEDKFGISEFFWSVMVDEELVEFKGDPDPDEDKEPIDNGDESEIKTPKSQEELMLEEFKKGPYGYILSGEVYP